MTRDYSDELNTRRPSLWKLTRDKKDSRQDLLQGFDSREDVLYWVQSMCVRTLGEIPLYVIEEIGMQYRPNRTDGQDPTLLAALLKPHARKRDLPDEAAQDLRRKFAVEYIEPAGVRAYKRLRERATEYVGESEDNDENYTAAKQRFIAMRPVLDEIDEVQHECLRQVLHGFESEDELIDWFDLLEQATHGEVDGEFLTRCYRERRTREMLISDEKADRRARQLFAAFYLLPMFNDGIRDLSGRANEQVDADRDEITPTEA